MQKKIKMLASLSTLSKACKVFSPAVSLEEFLGKSVSVEVWLNAIQIREDAVNEKSLMNSVRPQRAPVWSTLTYIINQILTESQFLSWGLRLKVHTSMCDRLLCVILSTRCCLNSATCEINTNTCFHSTHEHTKKKARWPWICCKTHKSFCVD